MQAAREPLITLALGSMGLGTGSSITIRQLIWSAFVFIFKK